MALSLGTLRCQAQRAEDFIQWSTGVKGVLVHKAGTVMNRAVTSEDYADERLKAELRDKESFSRVTVTHLTV